MCISHVMSGMSGSHLCHALGQQGTCQRCVRASASETRHACSSPIDQSPELSAEHSAVSLASPHAYMPSAMWRMNVHFLAFFSLPLHRTTVATQPKIPRFRYGMQHNSAPADLRLRWNAHWLRKSHAPSDQRDARVQQRGTWRDVPEGAATAENNQPWSATDNDTLRHLGARERPHTTHSLGEAMAMALSHATTALHCTALHCYRPRGCGRLLAGDQR